MAPNTQPETIAAEESAIPATADPPTLRSKSYRSTDDTVLDDTVLDSVESSRRSVDVEIESEASSRASSVEESSEIVDMETATIDELLKADESIEETAAEPEVELRNIDPITSADTRRSVRREELPPLPAPKKRRDDWSSRPTEIVIDDEEPARVTSPSRNLKEMPPISDNTSSARTPSRSLTPARPAPATKPAPSRTAMQMKRPIEQVLRYHYLRPENANQRSPWGMFHQIMIFGTDTQIRAGSRNYNAVAWLAGNNPCQGKRVMTVDRGGLAVRSGVGLQGHQGQMLAVFGLIGVPSNYNLVVNKRRYSVRDLVQREMADCRRGKELTFTLIGLSRYVETDATWTASDGQKWDFERVIAEELSQPVIGTACGGTHRLMALSHALNARRSEGRPVDGQWKRAEIFINDFIKYAYNMQNPDGSFSTRWFEGRENRNDAARKVQTTGHIVEWLLAVTPDSQLEDPRLLRAMQFLTNTLYQGMRTKWEVGPKGHALRSLMLYHKRHLGNNVPWRSNAVATRGRATR